VSEARVRERAEVTRVNAGTLIALEGLDGCGKSTQIVDLVTHFAASGRDVVATREPTDGPFGQKIRAMARSGDPIAPEEELRWFMEDRAQHVDEVIQPALDAGCVVVTDRYFLSSVAYQGARGLDWREILRESEARFPTPDTALLFEVEAAVGLARVQARGGPLDPAFERLDFLERVAEIFRALDRPYVVRIDASQSPDAVAAAAQRALGLGD
jgi:dTMP kinase